jgi:hypothetical protein
MDRIVLRLGWPPGRAARIRRSLIDAENLRESHQAAIQLPRSARD